MQHNDDSAAEALIQSIGLVLEDYADETLMGRDAEQVAGEWIEAGFNDAEEISDWLAARCFVAAGAQRLEMAGITAQQASLRTTAGSQSYEDTIAFKLLNHDLSLADAKRIITNVFWND